MIVIHADQEPADAAERRSDGEDGAVDRVDVDAHLLRRLAILRGRAHREAELGEAQKDVKQRRADNADAGDQNVHCADRAAADREAPIRHVAGNRARIGREDELHDLIHDEAETDGREQRRNARFSLQGPEPDPLDQHADERAGDEDDQRRHRQRRVQERDRRPADIGADRVDGAVGEIDQVGDAKNQREPDREQRVDIADDEAVDRIVDEGAQGLCIRDSLSNRQCAMAGRAGHDAIKARSMEDAVRSRKASFRPTARTGHS